VTDTIDPSIPLLQQFEGFRDTPYWDVNHYRVGYGSDTITKPDGTIATVQPGMKVTQDDAMRDLQRRTGETQADIKSSIGEDAWNKLTPQARASLTSVAYNYGHLPYSVQSAAAGGDHSKIAAAISGLSGANNGVNADRRQAEANNVLGIGAPAGRFALSGPAASTTDRPNVSGSASSSDSAASNLLSALLKQGGANRVPAYKPNDPNGALPQTKLEALIRTAAGQGTYTPPIVNKLNSLGSSLQTLFGGSQAGQGAPDQAGTVAPTTPAPTASSAAPPQPPGSSASLASADPGGTNLTEGRSASDGRFPAPVPRPEPDTADDMPFVNRQFATADRMPMLGMKQPPAPAGPAPFIGGRGMPAMMDSSPDNRDSGGSTSRQASPTTPATGGSDSTNLSPYANAYSPDYRPQSDNMTFDIPSMLRTLFGG
jgi:GH24 family phage-related lysozyme (muramidase)